MKFGKFFITSSSVFILLYVNLFSLHGFKKGLDIGVLFRRCRGNVCAFAVRDPIINPRREKNNLDISGFIYNGLSKVYTSMF